jgi:hypothetical protein
VAERERLTPGLQADLRQALGWPVERDDVLATGERISDQWQVLAEVRVEREARLTERRVWLQGARSQRRALLVDFSFAGKAFEQGWSVGMPHSGTLAFYPSANPLRALLADSSPVPDAAPLPQAPPSAAEWTALATRMAANPWAQSWPLWLDAVQLQYTADAECPWWLWMEARAIPLAIAEADAWQLTAMAAGGPVSIFGEWTGEVLRPLTAWSGADRWVATGVQGDNA